MFNTTTEYYGSFLYPISKNYLWIYDNFDLIARSLERADSVFQANYIDCLLYQEFKTKTITDNEMKEIREDLRLRNGLDSEIPANLWCEIIERDKKENEYRRSLWR